MKRRKKPPDVFMPRGAWVPKIISLMPLIEREKRRKRIRAKRYCSFLALLVDVFPVGCDSGVNDVLYLITSEFHLF